MSLCSKFETFSIIDLVESLSISMDLVSQSISNHHRRVAFICWQLANEMGLPDSNKRDLVISAMLHDCGALSSSLQLLTLHFETAESEYRALHRHAEAGYQLLKQFAPFSRVAEIIRYHHHPWKKRADQKAPDVPEESYILHLADRLDIMLRQCTRVNILSHRDNILHEIRQKVGTLFKPELIDPLEKIFQKDSYWLDIINISLNNSLSDYIELESELMTCDGALKMAEIFSQIIDFRSKHTACHSSIVAMTAGTLAGFAGFSEEQCIMMKIAGDFHDLGKLAIPLSILDKPGGLTKDERLVINTHSYYTYKILSRFKGLEKIRCWAAYHHERVDGNGYPFKLKGSDLDQGSRIVAVADVYIALMEERPYRTGMSRKDAIGILQTMSGKALDGDVVNMLIKNMPDVENNLSRTAEYQLAENRRLLPFKD